MAWPLSVVIFPGKSPKPILSIKIPWPQIHLWLNHKEREGGGRGAKKVIATETERKECTCIQIVCNPHNGNKNVTKTLEFFYDLQACHAFTGIHRHMTELRLTKQANISLRTADPRAPESKREENRNATTSVHNHTQSPKKKKKKELLLQNAHLRSLHIHATKIDNNQQIKDNAHARSQRCCKHLTENFVSFKKASQRLELLETPTKSSRQ